MSVGHSFRTFALLTTTITAAACTNGQEPERLPCPRRGPTFRLELTGARGPLPSDTRLSVAYGGSNVEHYDFRSGNRDNEDICCAPGLPSDSPLESVSCRGELGDASTGYEAGGAIPRRPTAIHCELSTNGAARLEVFATGYKMLEETLQAVPSEDERFEHCDVLLTRDVFIQLTSGDAGIPEP